MAIHSSALAWTTPWTEEPGGLQSMGPKESHTTECRHPFHPGADWRPLAAVWEKTGESGEIVERLRNGWIWSINISTF